MERSWRNGKYVYIVSGVLSIACPRFITEIYSVTYSGDSYSSVLPCVDSSFLPSPTVDMPLGIPFPGSPYTDNEQPNWVGYLVSTWSTERPLMIYNFAQGGDTVQRMEEKVENAYLDLVTDKRVLGEHWNSATSLFVFWIGINNIGSTYGEDEVQALVSNVFQRVNTTYETGARAFLFIDVPPVGKLPQIVELPHASKRLESICDMWNRRLQESVQKFSDDHPSAQCYQFSSHKCLDDILTNPTKFGFAEADATKRGGAIWVDHTHLTSAVHKILAEQISDFLKTI